MRFRRLMWLGVCFIVLALFLPGTALAQEHVIVQLEPVDDSGVSGTATLSVAGEGTHVVIDVTGLTAGASARATMHAGSCAASSASFASLPELKADAAGKATATGAILFRGTEDVALATMADGEHVIVVRTEGAVACGVIPRLTASPASLPVTGGVAFPLVSTGLGVLGVCLLGTGLFLKYRRTRTLRQMAGRLIDTPAIWHNSRSSFSTSNQGIPVIAGTPGATHEQPGTRVPPAAIRNRCRPAHTRTLR